MVQQAISTEEIKPITKKYHIALHPEKFPTKDSFNLGFITSWFKKKGRSNLYTLQEIFELCSEGSCIIPSHIEPNDEGTNYRFISSKLMFMDVDDDDMQTDPEQVLNQLSEVCAGLFFTSSHGIKGNRYRLVFVLDDYVREESIYKAIFSVLADELEAIGVKVDRQVNSPLQRMRTSTKGYIISNLNATYSVSRATELIERKSKEQMKDRAKKFERIIDNEYKIYSFEELKIRAEKIGYVEDINEWLKLGYSLKSYIQEGYIDDIEGFEIFTILCGGNDESVFWNNLKANNITIGSFIKASNDAGFLADYKYYHAIGDTVNKLDVKRVRFEKYIPSDYAKLLLMEEKNILVKSPTGSGKTHSFITAAKELAETLRKEERTHYFIFAVPTIAICDQVANDQNILSVRGETENTKSSLKTVLTEEDGKIFLRVDLSDTFNDSIYHKLSDYSYEGKRVVVCTYDMAEAVYSMLEKIQPFSSFSLIVDEYHQFTTAYGYRKKLLKVLVL
ncbi:DEAD/DEAH box helicase family protein [Kurthia senegalensis]|uniref:DEAD/DEAH box helicase family protein n=1 Tax=Kurthia senegalensis TaxID=1033740 RepID=UPI00028992F6|nr:DEAD/DEAH box helicase family protein [Kurthia senegalensis]